MKKVSTLFIFNKILEIWKNILVNKIFVESRIIQGYILHIHIQKNYLEYSKVLQVYSRFCIWFVKIHFAFKNTFFVASLVFDTTFEFEVL